MAKLPRYMKLNYKDNKWMLTIKKWGLPHLIYVTLKNRFGLKWYEWIIYYPYFCIRIMLGR